jgi:hypothetical protein
MTKAEIALTILVAVSFFALFSGWTQQLIIGGM